MAKAAAPEYLMKEKSLLCLHSFFGSPDYFNVLRLIFVVFVCVSMCVHTHILIYVCTVWVCSCPWRLGEGVRFLGTGVIDNCEPPGVGVETRGSFTRTASGLTAELSLKLLD